MTKTLSAILVSLCLASQTVKADDQARFDSYVEVLKAEALERGYEQA